jgi:hypothetical protein
LKDCANTTFLIAYQFPLLQLNPGRDRHELTNGHFIKPAWLKSFFPHRLKHWVRGVFLVADHFPLLHLNPDHNCWEMKKRFSVKLDELAGLFCHIEEV